MFDSFFNLLFGPALEAIGAALLAWVLGFLPSLFGAV